MITSKNIESKVFDFSQLNFNDNVEFRFIHENKPLTLITHDQQIIDEYFNKLWIFYALAKRHEKLFENEKSAAITLLKNIQHEYKFEN
jgi:hypothetical protein